MRRLYLEAYPWFITVVTRLLTRVSSYISSKYQWRKANKENLFKSRMAIRGSGLITCVLIVSMLAFPGTSGASIDTWVQTQWNGGLGSSTTNQYSSQTGIDSSTSGEFKIANTEKLSNTTFDSNVSSWDTGLSEITPSVVETTLKGNATGTTHSLPLRNIPQTGNVLVATIGFNSNPGTITMPAGWVLDADSRMNNNSTWGRVVIYHKIVQDGDPTTVVVQNSVSGAVNYSVQEITGVDLTDPIDQIATSNSGTVATTTRAIGPTAQTTRANAIAVAGVVYQSASVVSSWSNGFINANPINSYGYSGTKELTSKQQVDTTFTGVTARINAGALVVYKGALVSQQNSALPGVVQSKSALTTLSHAVTYDSPPQVGNTLIVAISTTSNPGVVTMPSGWILDVMSVNASAGSFVWIYHKQVEANEPPTFVIDHTIAAGLLYTIHEYSGLDPVSPLDQTSTENSGATNVTSLAIPNTPMTTTDDALAIARVGFNGTSAFTSWNSGFTNVDNVTNYGYTATKILTSTQQVGVTFTGVTARRNQGALAVYKTQTGHTPVNVQTKIYNYGAPTSVGATYPYAITPGNVLFATFNTRSNIGTLTPPSGWTQVAYSESVSGRATYLFSKVAGENEALQQFFHTQYPLAGRVELLEVRGITDHNTPDKLTTYANVNANPFTFSMPATSANRAFILGGFGTNATNGFPISWATNNFTTVQGSIADEFQVGFKTQLTSAPYNLSFTNASLRIMQGYLAAFGAEGNYVTATSDTGTKYAGTASAKLVSSPWSIARFTQNINVGDADSYEVSTYVYKDGSAIDAQDAQLYYDGDTIATAYTSVGSGWYRLSATIGGVNVPKDFGVELARNKTLFIDNFSVSRYENEGVLTSNIFDAGQLSNWGEIRYSHSGTGTVEVKVRSSNSPTMAGALNFSTCAPVSTGVDLSTGTNGCVTDAEQYIQYQVTLTRGSITQTPVFENIEIDYKGSDETPPDTNATNIAMFKSNGGDSVPLNGWTNGNVPYFSWDSALDNPGGIGVAGYCLYLGADNTADPVTTKGLLGTGDLDTENTCAFATANEYIDLAQPSMLGTALTTSNAPYYINIKAIDANNNIVATSASFHFRFDNTAPTNPSFINAPSNFISTKTATMTWDTSGGSAPSDSNSGVAGLQYRIGGTGTWYGDTHNGAQDETDLLTNDGTYTTQSVPDFTDLVEGSNVIYFRTFDQAGNISLGSVTTVLKINTNGAPSAPQNITATPTTNTSNSFAFEWIAPATFVGNVNNLTYCYTVNVTPTVNNCTYTTGGALNLAAGPYATQPGVNTLYVVARDESNSINYASYGTVEFSANTSAPGFPLNPDLADTSVRSTSNWRLVVSWEGPDDVGAGVDKYDVYRSTDGVNFTKAGSTGGTSYVDTGLNQVEYFYKMRACDSANNCGAFGSVVSATPTGRYTTPPNITSTGGIPVVSNIKTRSADISWATDRESDSKIAFGVSSGDYGSTEAYKSLQTMDHKISLENLEPGQTYYFVARWTDTDGNTGSTTEFAFQTLPPPTVEDVNAIEISLNDSTIQYTTTGATSVKLYYGITNGFGAVVESATSTSRSTYITRLRGLQDGQKYFYKVNTFDSSGFEYEGTTLTFETPPAPRIMNLRFQPVEGEKSSTQLVTWETNVPSTSQLIYGIRGGESLSTLDTNLVTSHAVTIKDLSDDSEYSLIARSRDVASNLAVSDVQEFRTALDTRPPKVSDVVIIASVKGTGTDARGQIVVTWKTDEPSTSQVRYGEGASGDMNNSSTQDSRLTLDHAVVISDLSTSKVYSIQAVSLDKGDNKATSDRQSAIIGRGTQSALGIIFSTLQKIFGVGK